MNEEIEIAQTVAILLDGNNIGMGIQQAFNKNKMLDFDTFVPKLLRGRGLKKLYFFREGERISDKLAMRLQEKFFGMVVPCGKSADLELAMTAIELAEKVDTIIICSGDKDFIPLIKRLHGKGVRVEIASVMSAASNMLLKEADFYYEIKREDCFPKD